MLPGTGQEAQTVHPKDLYSVLLLPLHHHLPHLNKRIYHAKAEDTTRAYALVVRFPAAVAGPRATIEQRCNGEIY